MVLKCLGEGEMMLEPKVPGKKWARKNESKSIRRNKEGGERKFVFD